MGTPALVIAWDHRKGTEVSLLGGLEGFMSSGLGIKSYVKGMLALDGRQQMGRPDPLLHSHMKELEMERLRQEAGRRTAENLRDLRQSAHPILGASPMGGPAPLSIRTSIGGGASGQRISIDASGIAQDSPSFGGGWRRRMSDSGEGFASRPTAPTGLAMLGAAGPNGGGAVLVGGWGRPGEQLIGGPAVASLNAGVCRLCQRPFKIEPGGEPGRGQRGPAASAVDGGRLITPPPSPSASPMKQRPKRSSRRGSTTGLGRETGAEDEEDADGSSSVGALTPPSAKHGARRRSTQDADGDSPHPQSLRRRLPPGFRQELLLQLMQAEAIARSTTTTSGGADGELEAAAAEAGDAGAREGSGQGLDHAFAAAMGSGEDAEVAAAGRPSSPSVSRTLSCVADADGDAVGLLHTQPPDSPPDPGSTGAEPRSHDQEGPGGLAAAAAAAGAGGHRAKDTEPEDDVRDAGRQVDAGAGCKPPVLGPAGATQAAVGPVDASLPPRPSSAKQGVPPLRLDQLPPTAPTSGGGASGSGGGQDGHGASASGKGGSVKGSAASSRRGSMQSNSGAMTNRDPLVQVLLEQVEGLMRERADMQTRIRGLQMENDQLQELIGYLACLHGHEDEDSPASHTAGLHEDGGLHEGGHFDVSVNHYRSAKGTSSPPAGSLGAAAAVLS